MRKLDLLVLSVMIFMAGCASSPQDEVSASAAKRSEGSFVVQKKEPVKVVRTVYYPVKETLYYADGAVDKITVYTYSGSGVRLLKKEVSAVNEALCEWEQYEYSGDFVPVMKSFDQE